MIKKNEEEIIKLRSQRLNNVMRRYGLKQADIAKNDLFSKSEVCEWVKGKRKITYDKGRDLIREVFPKVSIEYLMGDSEFMTIEDMFKKAFAKICPETEILNTAVINLLRLSGYTVNTHWEEGIVEEKDGLSGNAEEILSKIKDYCAISKNNRSVTLGISQFNSFANLVCDYTDFLLQSILKN